MTPISPPLRCALLWLLLALHASAPLHAADPAQRWHTLVTPHFYVHYYRNTRHDEAALAQRLARVAEQVHARLVPILGHQPAGRTHIVLTDDTDGANGLAQVVPRNVVRVYATGPSSLNALNDYDDWLRGLFLHEYTHILHIDTIHGLARVINTVLGKTWAPNQVQPSWFIEGMAIYSETAHSSGGRGRSAIYDMYLRSAVLEGKLLEIDQISSYTRYYPRGTVPYLYGGRFVQYLGHRFGEEKLRQLSHHYGGTPLPYAINRTAKEVLGHTFLELYEQFRQHLRRRYALQREAVERRGRTHADRVTTYGEACGSPRYSRDGRELVFIDTDGRSQFAVKVLDVARREVVESFDIFGGSGVDFTPDGSRIVYGASAIWRSFYAYHDLFVRTRQSGEVRRLTRGLRARDPAVSPDGGTVAFVTNELGAMSLCTVPFGGGPHRVLYRGEDGDQLHTPRWSPDGRHLVYSRWRHGGHRDIYLMELATGQSRRLTDDRALDMDPVFSPDGARVYFASDRSGIYNIYALELRGGELRQVTNVLGGAFVPAVSPDEKEAYYVGFSAKGYDLYAMALDRGRYLPALPYVSDRPAPSELPPAKEPYPEQRYDPLQSILPRAWMLSVGSDAYGTAIGVEVSGGDVVGHHSYFLAATFSTEHGRPNYGLSYSYNQLWPGIRIDTSRFEGLSRGLLVEGQNRTYTEENYGLGLTVGLPVLRIPNHSGDVSLGYRLNWFRDRDQTKVVATPDGITPRLPDLGLIAGLTAGLSYRSVERYAHSISPEKGRLVNVSLRVNHPALGSDYDSTTVSWSWTEYVDLPWAEDHVLALRYGGGIGTGDAARRGVFRLGGFPEQDVLRTLFDVARPGGVYLRGYAPGVVHGEQFHLLNVEYRLPLLNIERGILSLPIFINHLHMAAFVDVGNAFFGDFDPEALKVGVGGELLLEGSIGYVVPTTLRLGFARGLMEPGGNEFHILIGRPF